MAIKVNPSKSIKVSFDDMAGNAWTFSLKPVPSDLLTDLQNSPEKITSDDRILEYIEGVKGPIEGTIETEEDLKDLKEALSQFGDVISLLNTAVLKAYMNALERLARAEKNSQKH